MQLFFKLRRMQINYHCKLKNFITQFWNGIYLNQLYIVS